MKDLILEVKSAVENKEENFWQKAAFYSRAALAFQAMVNNKPELEAVSDRSYLFSTADFTSKIKSFIFGSRKIVLKSGSIAAIRVSDQLSSVVLF